MEVRPALTFFSAFSRTPVAAGECLITSWRWALLQHLHYLEIMYYHCKGHSEFLATGEKNAYFHFNKIQILTWIMWHRKGREGHENSSAILHTHPRAGKYYSLITNRLRDMILLQIRLSINDFSGVGKQKMCVTLILIQMFKFLKTPFYFLVCFYVQY